MKRLLFCICLYSPVVGLAQFPTPSIKPFIAFDDSVIALTHCTLADGIALKAMPDQTVVLHNGIITAIGPSSRTPLPKEARVMDCTGKSLLHCLVLMNGRLC